MPPAAASSTVAPLRRDRDVEIAIITLLADIALGGMAWRLAKTLEANQRTQTEILRHLTTRVENLEKKAA